MPNDLGISFVPGQNPQQKGNGAPVEPMQQAIKYLSLRLPKFSAGPGGGFAPTPLMGGTGSAGNPLANSALGQTQHSYLSGAGAPSGATGDALMQALLSLAQFRPSPPAAPMPFAPSPLPTSGPNLPAPPQPGPSPTPTTPVGQPPQPAPPRPAPPPPNFEFKEPDNQTPMPDVSIQPVGRPRPVTLDDLAQALYQRPWLSNTQRGF